MRGRSLNASEKKKKRARVENAFYGGVVKFPHRGAPQRDPLFRRGTKAVCINPTIMLIFSRMLSSKGGISCFESSVKHFDAAARDGIEIALYAVTRI